MMKMETSFDHVWLVRGHIDKIVSATGAGIRCPDVSCLKDLPKKFSIWIRGSMDSVFLAYNMLSVSFTPFTTANSIFYFKYVFFILCLQGLLPMQLMVQVPSDRFNSSIFPDAEEADVLINVERSALDTVIIKLTSHEFNSCKYCYFPIHLAGKLF